MAEPATPLSLAEAGTWVGARLSGREGSELGHVQGLYVDAGDGEPVLVIARLGRRRGARVVAIPVGGCAGAPFGAWAAYGAEAIRSAPVVDPSRPLRREHELTICAHFGIGERVGRAAAVAGREPDAITARPAG